eukprot:scaffold33431_cov21-Tisochrysis_lutea.AAC.1
MKSEVRWNCVPACLCTRHGRREYTRDFQVETVNFQPTGRLCVAPECGSKDAKADCRPPSLLDNVLDPFKSWTPQNDGGMKGCCPSQNDGTCDTMDAALALAAWQQSCKLPCLQLKDKSKPFVVLGLGSCVALGVLRCPLSIPTAPLCTISGTYHDLKTGQLATGFHLAYAPIHPMQCQHFISLQLHSAPVNGCGLVFSCVRWLVSPLTHFIWLHH